MERSRRGLRTEKKIKIQKPLILINEVIVQSLLTYLFFALYSNFRALCKVDDVEILEEYTYLFNAATQDWLNASSTTKIGLIIFIESAKALVQLTKICEKATKLKEKSALIPEALVFGSDDFVAGKIRSLIT